MEMTEIDRRRLRSGGAGIDAAERAQTTDSSPTVTIPEIEAEIEVAIRRVMDARIARAGAHGAHFSALCELAAEHLSGGKLLRPRLLMGMFDALTEARGASAPSSTDFANTAERPAALEVAAAVEILHFAFLLHDDLIDDDLVRRGKPNLIGRLVADAGAAQRLGTRTPPTSERQLHWARSSGLLVGDLMLTIAHQIFARARVPEERRVRLLDLLDEAVTETVAGEYSDVGLADGCIAPDLRLALDMTRMKTAAYTFELPLRLAGIIADSDPHIEHLLGTAGRHLGFAYQLQDDLLSAFGQSDIHGKDEFSDFRERKETALIAFARTTPAWPNLEQLFASEDFSHEVGRQVQQQLIACGAREFIEKMVEDQTRAALDVLTQHDSPIPTAAARFIQLFTDTLEGRPA